MGDDPEPGALGGCALRRRRGAGPRLTFAELWTEARHAAKAYVAAGVSPGDRVALWAPNIWEWPVALLGLQAAGAVAVPLNTRFKGAEAAYVLERSRARLLVTVDGFLGNDYVAMLADPAVDLPHLERIVVLRPVAAAVEETPGVPPVSPWIDFLLEGAKVADDVVDERLDALTPDDVSDIMFTSGTTGAPKGVMAAHGPTVRAFADWADLVGLRRGDRYLVINPFFHSFGYRAGIVASLVAGATMGPCSTCPRRCATSPPIGSRCSRAPRRSTRPSSTTPTWPTSTSRRSAWR